MVASIRSSGTFDTKAAVLAREAVQRTTQPADGTTTQTNEDAFIRYEREVSAKKKGHPWEACAWPLSGGLDLGR